jgi:mannose-1-phosphate guanylyltransferase
MIHPVIMAGGKGERFWPYSNSLHPKQLLPLVTKQSMLEDTLDHVRRVSKTATTRLIIGKNLEKPVKAKLKGRKGVEIVAEPMGRNTAAAVALACRLIQAQDPKGVMLVLTADHAIGPAADFQKALKAAIEVASTGQSLVTFGIKPSRPDVGFGYVEVAEEKALAGGLPVHRVKRFHEKPTAEKAKAYVDSGRFFWNSGMFAWRVDYLWAQFQKHQPALAAAFEKMGELKPKSPTFQAKLKKLYLKLPDLSIDYGIMEKADAIQVVVPNIHWDDIGSWSALDRLHEANAEGNRILGEAITLDSTNTTVFSDGGLVCTFGVSDLLVVQHGGVTLVVPKDKLPRIKELVKLVQAKPKLVKYL